MSSVILYGKSSVQFCINLIRLVYFNKSGIKYNIYKI